MPKFAIPPHHYVVGVDDFAVVLEELERELRLNDPRTHDRALALFAIIEWCVLNNRPIPALVGKDLHNAFEAFMSLDKETPTLDAALGLQRPTKGARKAWAFDYPSGLSTAAAIFAAVERERAAAPVDDALFERIGSALERPMSGGAAKAIYYEGRDSTEVLLELDALRRRQVRDADRE